MGDVSALVGEEAASDSGGDLALSVEELMVEYHLRRRFSYGSQVWAKRMESPICDSGGRVVNLCRLLPEDVTTDLSAFISIPVRGL